MFRFAAILVLAIQTTWAPTLTEWTLDGNEFYTLQHSGQLTASSGATVALQSATSRAPSSGRSVAVLDATQIRLRRVTLRGEFHCDAPHGASLWMEVRRANGGAVFDTGFDDRVLGTSAGEMRAMSMPVPEDATEVRFGVTLRGSGSVVVRGLRLSVSDRLTEDGPIAPAAREVVDAALDLVQTNALRYNAASWAMLERRVRTLASGAQAPKDAYPAIRYLLASLEDNHSSFMTKAQWAAYQQSEGSNVPPEVKIIQRTGYVTMPAYSGGSPDAVRDYALRLHDQIQRVQHSACGWIIDLRANSGGNVFPMTAGLKPFLGDAPLGRHMGRNGPRAPRVAGDGMSLQLSPELRRLEEAPVAVLIGPGTMSSGEAVALAFRGRDRTRLFGTPTAGRTTGNTTYELPDGARLILTVTVMADRTGRTYGGRIEPDEPVGGSRSSSGAEDLALAAAVQWLNSLSECAEKSAAP
jgi:C-terminal processing protease CtpA/Prc